MKNEKVKLNPVLATQSNALIGAIQPLSIQAKRVFLMLVAQINPDKQDDIGSLRIDVSEYKRLTGIGSHSYTDIKEGAKELIESVITIRDKAQKTTEMSVVLSSIKYHDTQGWLEAEFPNWIKPHLLSFKQKGFTHLFLPEVMAFKRFYTLRVFELMMTWASTGFLVVKPEVLKEILAVSSKYPAMYDFKKYVLEPSIKEINEKTAWQVSVAYTKKGREINSIRLTFDKEIKQNKESIDMGSIEKMKDKRMAEKIMSRYSFDDNERPSEQMTAQMGVGAIDGQFTVEGP